MAVLKRVWQRAVRGERTDPWFCLPVGVSMLLDAVVSLACQPGAYWVDPSRVSEGNATWGCLLARGPAVFILGFLLYAAVVMGLLLLVSGAPQKLLGAFVLLAHSYGAASWPHVALGDAAAWWVLMGLFLVEAAAFAAYWHLRGRRMGRRGT